MKLASLQDLYVEELKDLYSAETQLVKALPKMAQAASNPQLKSAFEQHLAQTEGHVKRLDQIFQNLGTDGKGKPCKGMRGLLEEGDEFLQENASPEVKDAGLISMAQRVEHYEIAGYGTVCTYAQQIGDNDANTLLRQTLEEEKQTDNKLTQLAESRINRQAETAARA